MWEKKGFVRNLIVVITFVVTNAVVVNFCCAADLSARKVFEGDLIFNKELPVGLTAGTSEYPELIEIKSVCFEGKYGNSWGIFMDIGWLPVVNS
ncbi:MAG: hypothetical protein P8016_04645, partial [Sedimentisphaerales bacterium]